MYILHNYAHFTYRFCVLFFVQQPPLSKPECPKKANIPNNSCLKHLFKHPNYFKRPHAMYLLMDLSEFLQPSPKDAITIGLSLEEACYLAQHQIGPKEVILFQAGLSDEYHLMARVGSITGTKLVASAAAWVGARSSSNDRALYEKITGMRRLQHIPSGGARVKDDARALLTEKPSTLPYALYFI